MAGSLVTVFGGSGFLGRRVVARLAARGNTVRVAVRHPAGAGFPEKTGPPGETVTVHGDVRDEASVTAALRGSDAVINAVGLYVERGTATFDAVHAEGALHVARQSAEAGVRRLVHVSGIGADPNSESRYVRARAQGEGLVRDAFEGATILRPSVLFGPGDAFFNTLAAIARLTPALPLFGNGLTRLQPVHVDDVARAAISALADASSEGKVYELGGLDVYAYRALVALLLKHAGKNRALIPVPFVVWEALAHLMAVLSDPPLTPDQVVLMRRDNVVAKSALTLADLGIRPTAVEDSLPTCLGRGFRSPT